MAGPIYPIPSPSTWQSGEQIKAPQLRSDVAGAIGFLAYRPLAVLANQSGSSQATGDAPLYCTVELYDNWNGHIATTASNQYYCQAAGWYLCRSMVPFNYTSATQAGFAGNFNGVSNGATYGTYHGAINLNGSTHPLAAHTCDLIPLYITGAIGGTGDSIGFGTYNGSGSAQTLLNNTDYYPYVEIRWVAEIGGTAGLTVPANPSWPVPPTGVTSTFLNTNIRDTVRFLLYPPILKAVYTPGTATLASSTFPAGSTVPLGTVVVDNYSGFSTSTHEYTVPVTGNYYCYGQVNLQGSTATTGYCAGFSVNGGTTQWGDSVYKVSDTTGGGMSLIKRLQLTAGQTVALVACQGSGSAIEYSTNTGYPCWMIMVWESTA